MSESALERLKKVIRRKIESAKLPLNIKDSLKSILEYIEKNKVVVCTPQTISTDLVYPTAISLENFMCPKCGKIYDRRASSLNCQTCNIPLIQAYVGAPVETGPRRSVVRISVSPSGSLRDYIVLPTNRVSDIYCSKHKGFKGLKAKNPYRPIYSLRFTCSFNDRECANYDYGFCKNAKGVFFMKEGGIQRAIAFPSEGLTKPYVEVVFQKIEEEKDLTSLFDEKFGRGTFDKVSIGRFKVYVLSLFYLIGHSYAARKQRLPAQIFNDRHDVLQVAGRSMETYGLLLCLNSDKVNSVVEQLKGLIKIDDLVVAHSIAHAAMKSLVRLTGLSYREFGEAIYIGGDQPEILIYDDSPGGIGGVETVKEFCIDFISYLEQSAAPCPRACRSACKACLYLENCGNINFLLSWMAVNYYLLGGSRS